MNSSKWKIEFNLTNGNIIGYNENNKTEDEIKQKLGEYWEIVKNNGSIYGCDGINNSSFCIKSSEVIAIAYSPHLGW